MSKKALLASVLFSGGKDSNFALFWAYYNGFYIKNLLTVDPSSDESMMFHYPNIKLTKYQSFSLGIPIKKVKEMGNTKEDYINTLIKLFKKSKSKYIIVGALKSEYQRFIINYAAEESNKKVISPLWHKNEILYLKCLLKFNIKFIITSISCEGMPIEYLGKTFNWKLFKDILIRAEKYKFSPVFEGGEAETFVIDMPLYRYYLKIKEAEILKENEFNYKYIIKKIKLIKKDKDIK